MNRLKRKLVLLTLVSSLTGVFASCGREDVVAGPMDRVTEDDNNKIINEEMIENSTIITSEDVTISEDGTLPVIPTIPEEKEEESIPVVDETLPEEETFVPEETQKPLVGTSYVYHTIEAITGVNVRREPVNGDVLAVLPKGEKLTYLGLEDDWYHVLYNGIDAYVSADYAKVSEDVAINIPEAMDAEIYEYDVIEATGRVNIRTKPVDGKILGVLPVGKTLTLLDEVDGWYKVLYYGEEAYVSANYAYQTTRFSVAGERKKIMYAVDELTIYIPYEVNENGMVATLNELECLEVYGETDDLYLVKTNDYVGYVPKRSLKELSGTFVVVDISDQNLKLYVDNEVIVDTPVVTGKTGTPSDIGLFDVDGIDYYRYLKGPGYKTWVDVFAYYNGGEGLHDAEYHSCDNGGNHGWRSESEFGGDTYIKGGSHGCVNMKHEDVMEVVEYIEVGTPVLVKK